VHLESAESKLLRSNNGLGEDQNKGRQSERYIELANTKDS